MKKERNLLAGIFTLVMLLFAIFMAVHTVMRADLDFRLDDTQRSLETSQGRERKQQYEYDEVVAQLPLTRAELAETQPLADAAASEVADLKAERKRLRAEKKELEEKAAEKSANDDANLPALDTDSSGVNTLDGEEKEAAKSE